MRLLRAGLAVALGVAITTVGCAEGGGAGASTPAATDRVEQRPTRSSTTAPGPATVAGASLTRADRAFLASSWPRVWRDDFSGRRLSSRWQNCYPWKTCTNESNNESQWYRPNNAQVRDGLLHLIAHRQTVVGTFPSGRQKRFPYTSAMVQTSGSFAARTGRVEVRAKSVAGKSIWPALWLLPTDQSWPPEIDFFEQYGAPRHFEQTLHTGAGRKDQFNQDGIDTTAGFHTYGVLWNSRVAIMTVDGRVTGVSHSPHADKPLYLLMNQAVGGTWVGAPDATTPRRSDFQIDSVAVYAPAWALAKAAR